MLTANKRLIVGARRKDVIEIRKYAEWILKVRDGELGEAIDIEVLTDVGDEILLDAVDDSAVCTLYMGTEVSGTPANGKHLLSVLEDEVGSPGYSKRFWQDIISASLKQSYLWDHCKVLKLTKNMRLTVGARPEDVTEIHEFAEWILKFGDDKTERNAAKDQSIFSPEFVNGLKFSGEPNHRLALKCAKSFMELRFGYGGYLYSQVLSSLFGVLFLPLPAPRPQVNLVSVSLVFQGYKHIFLFERLSFVSWAMGYSGLVGVSALVLFACLAIFSG
ncbi:ATP-dependent DNA helicase PIF1-like protein [Tanacetum coccineum]